MYMYIFTVSALYLCSCSEQHDWPAHYETERRDWPAHYEKFGRHIVTAVTKLK